RFGLRVAVKVEPGSVIETGAIDDQSVAFPPADRVAKPCGVRILRQSSAIGVNRTREIVGLTAINDRHTPGCLDQTRIDGSEEVERGQDGRKAMRRRVVPAQAEQPLLKYGLGPGLNILGLQILRDIPGDTGPGSCASRLPQA